MEDNPKRQTNRWFRVDVGMPEHPKLEEVGCVAGWTYVCSIAYCARNLTDGFLPHSVAWRLASCGLEHGVPPVDVIGDLLNASLWDEDPARDYSVRGYLDYQQSRADVAALRERRAEAGRRGAAARWQKPWQNDGKAMADVEVEVEVQKTLRSKPPPGGAQALTAHFVDESRRRGSEPSKRIVGMLAGRVSALLAENISAEAIHAGIELMLDRRKGPQLLDSFVHEAALTSIRAPWQAAPEPEVDYPLLPVIEEA